MPVAAVFPNASAGSDRVGMYESFYLRAVDPAKPRGIWIRCTVRKPPGRPASGSVWCTVFNAEAGAPFMHKLSGQDLSVPAGGWIAVGETRLGPGVAQGTCGRASWSLRFDGAEPELAHLPHPLLYRAPLPRTKLSSPAPSAIFSGALQIGERTIELDGWPGMVGHNWGAEHAERWIWLHGIAFDQAPQTWLDLAIGRIAIGGRLTPWIASGALSLEGQRTRLGGLLARGLRVAERPERCSLRVPGQGGLSLEAHVQAPPGTAAGWRYADPGGGEHDVVNCSIAALRLVVRRDGHASRTLLSPHGAAYELGMREHDHGVPIAPFADD
jgi:hypothetical protein